MSDLRMPDLNKVFLAGRLTRDPELRYIPSGQAVCKLGLAVSRVFKTPEGEKKEDTMFIDVTVWEKSAEYCSQNLKKGRPVIVEGRLKMDSWDDKTTGQKKSKIEVVAVRVQQLDWDERAPGAGQSQPKPAPAPREIEEPIPEDDVPF
jgi:single-strand DNA-binding protein